MKSNSIDRMTKHEDEYENRMIPDDQIPSIAIVKAQSVHIEFRISYLFSFVSSVETS